MSVAGCVTVTYAGPPARVRLYGDQTVSGLESYVTLTLTRGTGTVSSPGSCAGFLADPQDYIGQGAGVIYRGALGVFPADYDASGEEPDGFPGETWTDGETHVYRFHVSLNDTNAAQGLSVVQYFTWEARSTP
jgi:hypothetical protein